MEIEKKRYYFGFRFEQAIAERINRHCKGAGISLNRLVGKAFDFAAELHDRRKILFTRSSNFLEREDEGDKVSPMLILDAVRRNMVRNFAFAYGRSMAEIIRVALEVYLDFLDTDGGKFGKIKHYYKLAQCTIQWTMITLSPAFPPKIPPDQNNIDKNQNKT